MHLAGGDAQGGSRGDSRASCASPLGTPLVSSSFLISFVMGGSGLSRVINFLNAPERPEQGD
jgi:hypothetical protein